MEIFNDTLFIFHDQCVVSRLKLGPLCLGVPIAMIKHHYRKQGGKVLFQLRSFR